MEFDEAVRQYQDSLLGFAISLTRDVAWAEDVVQDVWVKVWLRWEQIDGNGSVKSYLLSAVKTTFLDHIRKRNRRQADSLEVVTVYYDQASVNPSPLDLVIQQETENQIAIATTAMRPKRHEAFIRYFLEGQTDTEIGEAMGISRLAVRRHNFESRRMMRERIPDH